MSERNGPSGSRGFVADIAFEVIEDLLTVPRSRTVPTTLIGLDCATQPKKVGLARGTFARGQLTVHELRACSNHAALVDTIASWIREPTLLAIDAPLGWPQPLGEALSQHRAGAPLDVPTTQDAFSRFTDHIVWTRCGHRPLDVGADRIARTAHAALLSTDHALDAVLCLLAAADFLRGHAVAPATSELERARREGWIWFRPRPD
jgi:hypothetical protein